MTPGELTDRIAEAAEERFSRSGGPGGQHVNKASTQVILSVPLDEIGLSEEERERVGERLASRLTADGKLIIRSSETRSQHRNREIALERAVNLIESARHGNRRRRPTRPSRGARERRLQEKRARGERKRNRRPPDRGGE